MACPRVVFLGAPEVGKSAIISRLRGRDFPNHYEPTSRNIYLHRMDLSSGCSCQVELVDTSGEQSASSRYECLVSGDVFVVVFSVHSASSLENARELLADLDSLRQSRGLVASNIRTSLAPVLLLANQAQEKKEKSAISSSDSRDMRTLYNVSDYLEISARLNSDFRPLTASLFTLVKLVCSNDDGSGRAAKQRQHKRRSVQNLFGIKDAFQRVPLPKQLAPMKRQRAATAPPRLR